MKKEVLRIHNLNLEYSPAVKLENINLCLMAGENVGFLGLVNSGKNLMVDILYGDVKISPSCFYIHGEQVIKREEITRLVYKITKTNYIIDNWTVAEYICLVSDKAFLGIYRRKSLLHKTEMLLKKLNLDIDVHNKLKNLTELEKRMIDLVKAFHLGAKIIIISDEFEGCSNEDILKFKQKLEEIKNNDIVVITNCYSDHVLRILSDRFIVFHKGYILKKWKGLIQENNHLSEYLLNLISETAIKKEANNENDKETAKIIYSIHNLVLKENSSVRLDFFMNEVVILRVMNAKVKKQLFDLLTGRLIDKGMKIYLEDRLCQFHAVNDFIRSKIVSIANLGGKDELFLEMSAGDNLLIPSVTKISALDYMHTGYKMSSALKSEMKVNLSDNGRNIRSLGTMDYVILLLEKWYIYNPKILILYEPFIHCDIYGVSVVKSYIKKFIEIGTTVIIVQSREEYVEDISDRIIKIDE